MDVSKRHSLPVEVSKKNTLSSIRPSGNNLYKASNMKLFIVLTKLRVGLSYLKEHTFKHSSLDTLNPICPCGSDIKSLTQFFRPSPLFVRETDGESITKLKTLIRQFRYSEVSL